jgi:hypothetical protein
MQVQKDMQNTPSRAQLIDGFCSGIFVDERAQVRFEMMS